MKVYKVFKFENDNLYSALMIGPRRMHYPINAWTYSPESSYKITCFSNMQSAREFLHNGLYYNLDRYIYQLWECEAEVIKDFIPPARLIITSNGVCFEPQGRLVGLAKWPKNTLFALCLKPSCILVQN